MSIKVFAAANPKFYFSTTESVGQTFDRIQLISTLTQMELTKTGALNGAVEHCTPGIVDLVQALAFREALQNLTDAMGILAMCYGSADGSIFIALHQKNLILTDDSRSVIYDFSPGDSPATEFFSRIAQPLEDTGMNTWNAAMVLSTALSEYAKNIDSSDTPKIVISMDKD